MEDADLYFNKAEAHATKHWYDYIYDTTDKHVALECYLDAANLYKSLKQHDQSAIAFEKAGDLEVKNKCHYKVALHYLDAAIMLQSQHASLSNTHCDDLVEKAVKLHVLQGRFDAAAKALSLLLNNNNQVEIYKRMIDYYNVDAK